MEKYGLILNFVGAFLLVIGSSWLTSALSNIIDTIADKFGTMSMEKIDDRLIKKFRNSKNISLWINLIGYLLFIVGFGLQIYSK